MACGGPLAGRSKSRSQIAGFMSISFKDPSPFGMHRASVADRPEALTATQHPQAPPEDSSALVKVAHLPLWAWFVRDSMALCLVSPTLFVSTRLWAMIGGCHESREMPRPLIGSPQLFLRQSEAVSALWREPHLTSYTSMDGSSRTRTSTGSCCSPVFWDPPSSSWSSPRSLSFSSCPHS